MMRVELNWEGVRQLFDQAFRTTRHYAIATVTAEGTPHVTPIGSLILRAPGHAIYFEEFPRHLSSNLDQNPNVCVLAVNSGFLFWLLSIVRGRCPTPPAVRLHGRAGPRRPATSEEIALWHGKVSRLRNTKGYRQMWAGMHIVRDIHFTRLDGVHFGEMTHAAWSEFSRVSKGDGKRADED